MTIPLVRSDKKLKLWFATSNEKKFRKLKAIINLPIHFLKIDMLEIQGSKKDIAIHKLLQVKRLLKEDCAILIDSSTIDIEGLGGFPGQYGEAFLSIGLDKVQEIVKKVGSKAVMTITLGLTLKVNGRIYDRLFYGESEGMILTNKKHAKSFEEIWIPNKAVYESVFRGEPFKYLFIASAVAKMERYLVDIGLLDLFV